MSNFIWFLIGKVINIRKDEEDMKKILIVDDEEQILKALTRMFLETDYDIITAENGERALALLETDNIDLIISDMRMPLMDGYKLLSTVKEKYPKVIRVLLSGYADEKPIFRAILHNIAQLYFYKPWHNDKMLQDIDKVFADDALLYSKELEEQLKVIGCQAEIPDNCRHMITLIENEDMEGLIEQMEQDSALSLLLVQVAKSSIYGVMPDTVKKAANYIGLHNLKCFMYWACIVICGRESYKTDNEPELLWKHAYLTNRIFLFLYESFLHKQPPESTLFAGLLHNIGLILLDKSINKANNDPFNVDAASMIQIEFGEHRLGHQEIGGYFLNKWDLPFPMCEAALFHHRPLDSVIVNTELVSAVHIAGHYAWRVLKGQQPEDISPEVFHNLHITEEEFDKKLSRYLKNPSIIKEQLVIN
jgi:response regulator RpfG family c-di-GMP phosphodiesterase